MNENLLNATVRIDNPELFADEAGMKAYVARGLAQELADALLLRVPVQWSVVGRSTTARIEAVVMTRDAFQQELAFAEMRGRVSYRYDYTAGRVR